MTGASRAPRPHVLLLHGQPGSARDWDGVVSELGERALALAVDRPGWGGSKRPPSGLAGNAAAAAAALDRAGISRAIVVGHSFGGAIAAWLASEHPERVSALVLAAPSANRESLVWIDRLLALPVAGWLAGAAGLGAAGAVLSLAPARRTLASIVRIEESRLAGAAGSLRAPSTWQAFHLEQRALLAELPELERRLSRVSAPTTIIFGSADVIVPPASARALAGRIPQARLLEVPGAGHLLGLRHPATLAQAIVDATAAA